MKKEHQVTLVGILDDQSVAKTHQASEVIEFWGSTPKQPNYFKVSGHKDEDGEYACLFLQTKQGRYEMVLNRTTNVWQCTTPAGVKVHVTLKKIVGKLIYWA
jgi:hypothetical protein